MENVKEIIAKNLLELRKQRRYTQQDLATKLNYSDKAISRWEHAETLPDIETLCKICDLYGVKVPEKGKTTYNVGIINGGTSVNTIAEEASALVEYRSDDEDMLAYMKNEFERIFEGAKSDSVKVKVELIGNRPCAGKVDLEKIELMKKTAAAVTEEVIGEPVSFKSGSTDCNIPLSLGIPALCFGVYNGKGCHTRNEYVEKASLLPGLEIGIKAMIKLCAL